jgi:NTE family protein
MADASREDDLAIVLFGGGARAAYQVGLLRWLAAHHPELRFPIITGVSAGAINATYLAAHPGNFAEAVSGLTRLWSELELEQVFRVDPAFFLGNVLRWGIRLVSGGGPLTPQVRGLVDTSPLRALLETHLARSNGEIAGIAENLEAGRLKALAIITSSYSTGQSVAWVQGCAIEDWERAQRRSRRTRMTVDHVMASAALPILFPAVPLEDAWYGDGGIRLSSPCSPAIHLGARRILVISNRYRKSLEEADQPQVRGYPPPIQISGHLLDGFFLDDLDQDALSLKRINELLEEIPPERRRGLRRVDLLTIRPSRDFGKLAAEFEPRLPFVFRHLVRGLGSRETVSPDLLSLLLFQRDYVNRLIEIGEADAEARAEEIHALLEF